MEFGKFKSILLEEIDCFTHDYQELKKVLEEALVDIEYEYSFNSSEKKKN